MALTRMGRKLSQIKRDIFFLADIYIGGATPVVVYQMGKVGSTSVKKSLTSSGVGSVYSIHRMNPINIEKMRRGSPKSHGLEKQARLGLNLYRHIIKRGRDCRIVTLIREPIARNISAFFQNLEIFTKDFSENTPADVAHLMDIFVERYNHEIPLSWFDTEMKRTLQIDIYEYEFPKKTGYQFIESGPHELLILKCELSDSMKEHAINKFLGMESFRLIPANVAEEKEYYDTYIAFKRRIGLPETYVEMMCSSKYMRHFYEETEIDTIRSRWLNNSQGFLVP